MTDMRWRECPECGSESSFAEIICPHCGHALPPPGDGTSIGISHYAPSVSDRKQIRLGVFWGTVAGLAQTEFGQLIFKYAHNTGNAWITANYVLVPLIAGIVGSFFWRMCRPTATELAGYSSQTAAFLLLISFVLNWIGFIPAFFIGFLAITAFVMFLVMLALATGVVWLGSFIGIRLFGSSF